jgi:hypothetical protein
MKKGSHHSQKSNIKNSLSHQGKHSSLKTEFKKGQVGWSKGKHLIHSGSFKKGHKPYPGTEKTRFKKGLTPWSKGLTKENDQRIKSISDRFKGKNLSEDHKKKLSLAHKGKPAFWERGERNPNWKGGRTDESKILRMRIEYRLWREAVFARDNWTCQKYKIKGERLHPHHIQNFRDYPELRFALDNGITLSEKAHKEFHRTYGTRNNTKEQIIEFIKYGKTNRRS